MSFLVLPGDYYSSQRTGIDGKLHDPDQNQTLEPSIPHPMAPHPSSAGAIGFWSIRYGAVTGGFVDVWIGNIPILAHRAIFCNVALVTSAGCTCSWRLQLRSSGGTPMATSGQYDQGTSSGRNWRMEWLHGIAVWTFQDLQIVLQVDVTQRTTPITDVTDVFIPYGGGCAQRVPIRATTDGLLPGGL